MSLIYAITRSAVLQYLRDKVRIPALFSSVWALLCIALPCFGWAHTNFVEVATTSIAVGGIASAPSSPSKDLSPLAQLPPNRSPRVVFLRQAALGQSVSNQGLMWWQPSAAEASVGFPDVFARLGVAIEKKLMELDSSGRDRVQIVVTRGELMKASRQIGTRTGYRWSRRGDVPMIVDTSRGAYAETQVQFEVRWTHYMGEQRIQKTHTAKRKMLPEVGYEEDLIEPLRRTVPQMMAVLQDDILMWLTMEAGALALAPTQSRQ